VKTRIGPENAPVTSVMLTKVCCALLAISAPAQAEELSGPGGRKWSGALTANEGSGLK